MFCWSPSITGCFVAETKFIRTCSIWRALGVVGDFATLLILESIWQGARRFSEIQSRTDMLKALLSGRLKQLVANGLLVKVAYTDTPKRYEYRMTEKCRELYWTALMMLRWEKRWSSGHAKTSVILTHKGCGQEFDPIPSCSDCEKEIFARDVTWQEGPGVGWMAPTYSRRRQGEGRQAAGERTSLFHEIALVTGDRWAGLILRSVFTRLRKFDEIRKDTGIATNILSDRLNQLVESGFLFTHAYQDAPKRYEYRLTDKGWDYYPVLLMLLQWGDKWYASPEGPPLLLNHKLCGHELTPTVNCSACGGVISPDDVSYTLVEGAKKAPSLAEG